MSAFVVIDVGCLECGVSSEAVGLFKTRTKAEKVARARDAETRGWREGGQTFTQVFEVGDPA